MKRTIYLFVFVLFAFFCGCHSQQRDVELLNPETPFSSISDFESFAKSHPDSALQLLGSDLERPETKADKADFYYKTLLYSEIRLKKFFPPESDTLPLAVVAYYDSIFYADSTGKADRRAFMQNQWLRARAHFVLGTAEQAGYEYMKAMQHHLTALRILDAYFADSDNRNVMLLRGNIEFYMADLFYYMGYMDLAKNLYLSGLQIGLQNNDTSLILANYYSIGSLCEISSSDSLVLFGFEKTKLGLKYIDPQHFPYETAQIFNTMGNYYRYFDQYDSALIYFNKALNVMPADNDAINAVHNTIGFVYYILEDYPVALSHILQSYQAKSIYRKNGAIRGAANIFQIMGDDEKAAIAFDDNNKYQKKIEKITEKNIGVQTLYDNYTQDYHKQHVTKKVVNYFIIMAYVLTAIGLVVLFFYLRNRIKVKRLKIDIRESQNNYEQLEKKIADIEKENEQQRIKNAQKKQETLQLIEKITYHQEDKKQMLEKIVQNEQDLMTMEETILQNHKEAEILNQQINEYKIKNSQLIERLKKITITQTEDSILKNKEKRFQKQQKAFKNTEIFQMIAQCCPEAEMFTWEMVDQSDKWLSNDQIKQLREVMNSLFNNGIQKLSNCYFSLNKSDILYCMLSLLIFSDKETAVLMHLTHQGFVVCQKRVPKKLETDNVNDFITKFLINEM